MNRSAPFGVGLPPAGHCLRARWAPALFLGCTLLVGCSQEPSWNGTVESVGGVEVITNPLEPLLPATDDLALELWTVQEPDWVDPSRIHASPGLVTITDPPANRIYQVTSDGDVRPAIGGPGGGPGEFLGLRDAFVLGDRLAALDAGKGSVEYLEMDGTHQASQHLEGQIWSGFSMGDGTLLAKGEFLSDPRAETRGDWVTIGEDGYPTAFADQTLEPLPEEQGVVCSDLSPWPGGAARMRYTTPQIQILDREGDLVRETRVDFPVEAVTEAEREAALSDLRESLAGRGLPPPFIEQNLVVMRDRWKVKCRFGPLRFDASTRVAAFLEQNPDEFGAGNATLHFLSEDGVYLARVTFPEPWRDFAMDDGVVYALARRPLTDVITLKAYRVDLPEGLLAEAGTILDEARSRDTTRPQRENDS